MARNNREIVCSNAKCGGSFNEPIELTVRAEGSIDVYQACPHCLSPVSPLVTLEKALRNTAKSLEKTTRVRCAHSLGYLKTRPKSSPIPDECLSCSKILKCM